MAEALPQFFGYVGGEGSEHRYQGQECFARDICIPLVGGCGFFDRLIESVDLVRQLHQRRDASVQVQPLFKVLGYRADYLMRTATQLALMALKIILVDRSAVRPGNPVLPLVSNSPDSLQVS